MTRRPAASPVDGQPAGTADGTQPAAEPPRRTAGRHALTDRSQVAGQGGTRAEYAGTRAERIAVAEQPAPPTGQAVPPTDQAMPPTDQAMPPTGQAMPPTEAPDRNNTDSPGRNGAEPAGLPAAVGLASRNGAAPAGLDGRVPAAPDSTPQVRTRPPAGATGRRRHAAAAAGPSVLNRAVRWVILLAVTAAAVFGLRQYVIASYYIPSASMETTLHGCPGCQPDMVLVDKLSYRFKSISRSDVVVFARPPQAPPEDKQLIKRVIGLPGDLVSGHDGHVFVDNKELVEPYVNPACHGTADFAPVRVPTGRYFVMGDNRCDSFDSRMFGTIPRSAMIGRAFAVIWPVHHLRWL